jgi:hypothetical protein
MLSQVLQEIANDLRGASAADSDIRLLRSRLPNSLVPNWLVNLLEGYKLAGVCFSLSSDSDNSGLGAEVIWLTPEQIVSETTDSEPGRSVVASQFLPIGACAIGSGDPYFLDLREASNDPPVVRVPHDYAGGSSYPLERVEVVSPRLSDFFRNAKL